MKIALIQNKVTSVIDENISKVLQGIKIASKKGAQIICLQELFSLPYIGTQKNKEHFNLATQMPNKTTELLAAEAKKHNIVLIGGSFFEKTPNGFFNTSIVFNNDGNILGTYRKIHIPNDPYYWEQFYFSTGDLGYKVFDTCYGKIGVLICYDQWFPEAARILALQGAQIIFYPTAIGWTKEMKENEKSALKNWVDVQRSHAITNHIFIAAANRVGMEDNAIDFWGSSFVSDPFGRIIKKASSHKEQVIVVDCDISQIEKAKQWMFTKNRRPETYKALTQ